MNDNNPYVLVLGASIVDIFGFCGRSYAQRDSIPGHIKISFGQRIILAVFLIYHVCSPV